MGVYAALVLCEDNWIDVKDRIKRECEGRVKGEGERGHVAGEGRYRIAKWRGAGGRYEAGKCAEERTGAGRRHLLGRCKFYSGC